MPTASGSMRQPTEMDPRDFEFLFEIEDRYFWFRNRRHLAWSWLSTHVPHVRASRFLEIGCGTGNLLASFHEKGVSCIGGDLFLEALRFARRRTSVPLCQLDANRLPFSDAIDVVGLFDVLEHVEEDRGALCAIRSALKPGGYLLLTVPAVPSLWSARDEHACHKRRYTLKSLGRALQASGFAPVRCTYFVSALFPIVWCQRRRASRAQARLGMSREDERRMQLDEMKLNPVINELLYLVLSLERLVLRSFSLPLGSSLIALARKAPLRDHED